MSLRSLRSRTLVSYARPQAFVDKTIGILARLGYRIMDVETFDERARELGEAAAGPELLIVEESRLVDVLEGGRHDESPVIVLTGRHGVQEESDRRIVGAIKRPAGLHDLYRLIQQVFEDTPRSTPRVPTELPAQCGRKGRSWTASLLSLSENGGLMRCSESLPLGACFELTFDLPQSGTVALRAEAAYQLLPNLGVVFSGIDPAARTAIGDFVNDRILTI